YAKRLEETLGGLTVEQLLADDAARRRHFAAVSPRPPARGNPDVAQLAARAKVHEARSLEEALEWLAPQERLAVLADHDLCADLVRLRGPAPSSAFLHVT